MKILSSGIDTLELSIDVFWKDTRLFDCLDELKLKAKNEDKEIPSMMEGTEKEDKWIFNVKPHGAKGYEWLLIGNEFSMRIGNWITPISRPSIMVEINSETLWRKGPHNTYERILRLIKYAGGLIISVKPSRADLCVDMLFDSDLWKMDLVEYRATRARDWEIAGENKIIKQIKIGRGEIFCRIYDKALEIKQKGKKEWFYKIWGIEKVPEDSKVIRVEFQIRREILKELGADKGSDFFKICDEIWAYCTKKWLKFQTCPGKHHTQRKTFEWWEMVQGGFMGIQGANPSIRTKAIKEDAKQLRAQIIGLGTSLTALEMERQGLDICHRADFQDCLNSVIEKEEYEGKGEREFQEGVIRKRAKYNRSKN